MKKILGIVVLGLLWCNTTQAETNWIKKKSDKSSKVTIKREKVEASKTLGINGKYVGKNLLDFYKFKNKKTRDDYKLEDRLKYLEDRLKNNSSGNKYKYYEMELSSCRPPGRGFTSRVQQEYLSDKIREAEILDDLDFCIEFVQLLSDDGNLIIRSIVGGFYTYTNCVGPLNEIYINFKKSYRNWGIKKTNDRGTRSVSNNELVYAYKQDWFTKNTPGKLWEKYIRLNSGHEINFKCLIFESTINKEKTNLILIRINKWKI